MPIALADATKVPLEKKKKKNGTLLSPLHANDLLKRK